MEIYPPQEKSHNGASANSACTFLAAMIRVSQFAWEFRVSDADLCISSCVPANPVASISTAREENSSLSYGSSFLVAASPHS